MYINCNKVTMEYLLFGPASLAGNRKYIDTAKINSTFDQHAPQIEKNIPPRGLQNQMLNQGGANL